MATETSTLARSLQDILADPVQRVRLTPATLAHFLTSVDQADRPLAERRGVWEPARHLRFLATELAQAYHQEGRLIIHMPPRHGKSELVSHWFPVWVLDQNPRAQILLGSYGADFAATWGRKVRDTIQRHELHLRVRIGSKTTAADEWYTTEGGGMHTAGVGGDFTGRGANVMIIDDPIKNRQEANSITLQQQRIEWINSAVLNRVEPGGCVIVMHTRWHQGDVAGYLLDRQALLDSGDETLDPDELSLPWRYISLPALAEEGRPDPLGRAPGEALWPERGWDRSRLLAVQRAVGPEWQPQYQGRPGAVSGDIFRIYWWRYWRQKGTSPAPIHRMREDGREVVTEAIDLPERFDEVFQSWDMAFKDTKQSDFVVGQVWGRQGPNFYLLAQRRARLSFVRTLEAVKSLSRNFPEAKLKLVENKANGPAVVSALRTVIGGFVEVDPADIGGKEDRARAVQWMVEGGNVYLPHPHQVHWVEGFVTECTLFPGNKGTNDDQVDGMTQALARGLRTKTPSRSRIRELIVLR